MIKKLTVLLGCSAAIHAGAAEYELHLDPIRPTSGVVQLNLDAPLTADELLSARRLPSHSNVHEPICVNTGAALVPENGSWLALKGCSAIRWNIEFARISQPDYDVSKQDDIYLPEGWWVFSEWGTLLRPATLRPNTRLCATVGGSRKCRRVPSLEEAPLLFAIGEPSKRAESSRVPLDFFVSHVPRDVDLDRVIGGLRRQVDYLSSVLSENARVPAEPIDVAWIGIDAAHGTTGGAAASDAFFANVMLSDGAVDEIEIARLRWICGHELSHTLGLRTDALWATESLAHYYGYKSIEGTEHSAALFDEMAADSEQHVGLLEAQRRFANGNEPGWYALFYASGIRFWRELDNAIRTNTEGRSSLDNYLPILLKQPFGPNGELPAEFSSAISAALPSGEFDRITSRYL